jgi:hypothetical protein
VVAAGTPVAKLRLRARPTSHRRWRAAEERASAAELIASPDDADARSSMKRGLQWVGYQVPRTETCDDGPPHLLTQVLTTPATTPDGVMGPAIQHDLATRDLLPSTHLLDGGDVDAELLVTAQTRHQIDVVGPAFGAYSHQGLGSRWHNSCGYDELKVVIHVMGG